MKETKYIYVTINGKKEKLHGFDTNAVRLNCDYSILANPFKSENAHLIKKMLYIVGIQTSGGVLNACVCAKCYQKIKNRKWFKGIITKQKVHEL